MIFSPIVARELRVAARRKNTFRARFWTACSAIGMGSFAILASGPRMQGGVIFKTMTTLSFLCCLSMAGNTSDCISEEKREGTLGFLFLTDLKGFDIALGKLMSGSLVSFYSLLGIFPIVSMAVMLGGVSAVECAQVALALLNAFFFAHCAGLFISTLNSKRSVAGSATLFLLAGYTAGLYLLAFSLKHRGMGHWVPLVDCFNPAYSVQWACDLGIDRVGSFARKFGHYWTSLLVVHLNAWIFLGLASWYLPRCWQQKASREKFSPRQRLRRWWQKRFATRKTLLDRNPFLWLILRNRFGSFRIWVILLALGAFWEWFYHMTHSFDEGMLAVAALSNHLMLKILAASEAAGCLEEQKHDGGLEFLLSCTPLSVGQIIGAQWRALRRQFLWPIVVVLITDAWLFWLAIRHDPGTDRRDEILSALATIVMLFADLYTMGWMGMWNALSRKRVRRAAVATIVQVILLPWVLLIGLQIFSASFSHPIFDRPASFMMYWFLLGIVVDVTLVMLFRPRLLAEFRLLASQPEEDPGFFGWLGRIFGEQMRAKSK